MSPEYVTEQSLTTHIGGVNSRIDDLSASINRVMDRIESHEGRITDTEVEVGVINKGITNGEQYSNKRNTGRRWLITTLIAITAVLIAGAAVWVAIAK